MSKIKRFDFFSVEGLKNAVKTDQGFLKSPVYATRVGVFKYMMPDGSVRRELRPPQEVFDADSMNTLANVPMTLEHPSKMVDTNNAKNFSVGMTGETVQIADKKFLMVNAVVTDTEAIRKVIEDNWVEVSCGYTAEVVEESGIYDGEEYDAVQTNIRYNHLAIVDLGRAGPEARFRLDSHSAILYDERKKDMIDIPKKESEMKVTLDGNDYEVEDGLGKAIKDMMKKMSDMEEKMKDKKDSLKLDSLTSEKETLEAKLDSANDEIKTLKEKNEELEKNAESKVDVAELVKERKAIEEVAAKILSKEVAEKMDEMTNEEIKKSVIEEVSPETKLDDKSEVYIDARFDAIKDNSELYEDKVKKAMEQKADNDDAEAGKEKMDARTKAMKESEEAWKKPLAHSKNNNN